MYSKGNVVAQPRYGGYQYYAPPPPPGAPVPVYPQR
jgi:hypothetical protein